MDSIHDPGGAKWCPPVDSSIPTFDAFPPSYPFAGYATWQEHLASNDHPLAGHPFLACLRWNEGVDGSGAICTPNQYLTPNADCYGYGTFSTDHNAAKDSGPGTTNPEDLIDGRFYRRTSMWEQCIEAMNFGAFIKENCAPTRLEDARARPHASAPDPRSLSRRPEDVQGARVDRLHPESLQWRGLHVPLCGDIRIEMPAGGRDRDRAE